MAKQTIEERINDVLDAQIPCGSITPVAQLETDLAFDSLDIVEITMGLEEEFHISIPDAAVEKWTRVKDVIAYIEAHYPETAKK